MCTSLTRNRSMNPTRGLQLARHGPVASRQSTRRLLRERSLQPLAPYAPAARFILSRRSLRSLHVPTPSDSVHSAGTSFHGFFVDTVYVSRGSEANRHGPEGMICFANFGHIASQILVILLRKIWSYCFANFGNIASQNLVILLRKFGRPIRTHDSSAPIKK